jgi:ABC-type transport system involved in multi-copper enzyme maturation permease subunit
MDSTGSTLTFGTRLMPFLAILRYDLRTLMASWLVRLWLAGSVLLTLLVIAVCWRTAPTAELIAGLLAPYLVFPWFLVVLALGVDPVSAARTEALADGILCRPVTRAEYLLASWAARVVIVLGNFLVVLVPAAVWLTLAQRSVPGTPVTVYGVTAAMGVVGLVLAFLVSFAYLLGTLLRRPLLAIVVVLFIWYPINLILDSFKLEAFSTVNLTAKLPTLMRTPWRAGDQPAPDAEASFRDLANSTASFLSVFGGAADTGPVPEPESGFFKRAAKDSFSLLRVILGYGLSTVVCVGLTLLAFCYRDL